MFFADYPNGFNGATLSQAQAAMANMVQNGMIPPTEKYHADNDIILTNKFRLNMKAKVNDQLSFDGRLVPIRSSVTVPGLKSTRATWVM